jgi:hypothetical protein
LLGRDGGVADSRDTVHRGPFTYDDGDESILTSIRKARERSSNKDVRDQGVCSTSSKLLPLGGENQAIHAPVRGAREMVEGVPGSPGGDRSGICAAEMPKRKSAFEMMMASLENVSEGERGTGLVTPALS